MDRPATEMAGRFMLEKLSHSSRSRNLLGAHFPSASALLIRTTASDGRTTLGNHLRGLSAHPSTVIPSHHVIHGSVARYYSTFSFSCPAAKTRSPTTGMSSVITHPMIVDFVRGQQRTFSSKIIKHGIDWEAERAIMEAQLEANKKISNSPEVEASNAEVRADFERCKAWLDNLTDTSNAELAAWRDEMDNYKKKHAVARFESIIHCSIFKLSDAWILCQALRYPRLHEAQTFICWLREADKFDRLLNGILCVWAVLVAYGYYIMHTGLECRHQSLIAARANAEDQNPKCFCKCHCDSSENHNP